MWLNHPITLMCGEATPILKSGCCWRVGNGESIKVLTNKWIPNYPTIKILHLAPKVGEGWIVSDLIDLDLHSWRRDIIMTSFNMVDADAICRVPLSCRYDAAQ